MNLSLIIACITIILALIVLPLIVSYKAEKRDNNNKNECLLAHYRKSDCCTLTNIEITQLSWLT